MAGGLPWSQRPSRLSSPARAGHRPDHFEQSALILRACAEMILDVSRLLHQAAEGTLRVGAPCVKENAKLLGQRCPSRSVRE